MEVLQLKIYRRFIVLLGGIMLLGLPVIAWSGFETKLSDTHIQSAVYRHFPLREYAAFARITLHEPQVILSQGERDMVLVIPVDANIPDQPLQQGHATVAVSLSYKPGNGGLYLINPRVIKFEMPSVSKIMNKNLRATIEMICKNALPLVQIYKLKEKDLNHSLAKSVLKSFSIKDSLIHLEFGFN